MKRLATFVAALVLLAGAPVHAQDSAAVAINTKDGFELFRLAFHLSRSAGDVVDSGNAAVAYASCTDCQTVAIAIQVVLVFGNPSVVTPENLAIAINENCSACDTLASAYQWVLSTGGPAHFTAEGNRRLAEIRQALLALRDSGLSAIEIQARVDALMEELAGVLATELVAAGPPSPSVSPTPSSSPTLSSPPSPAESPSPPESPSPTPSASSSP